MVGRRALTEWGNALGTIHDVTFDARTGDLEVLQIGDQEVPSRSLLGSGSYAVVLDSVPETDG